MRALNSRAPWAGGHISRAVWDFLGRSFCLVERPVRRFLPCFRSPTIRANRIDVLVRFVSTFALILTPIFGLTACGFLSRGARSFAGGMAGRLVVAVK